MNPPLEAALDQANLPGFVFINFSESDRDPKNKLSLINTHCSTISHRQRRNNRPQNTSTVPGTLLWTHAAGVKRKLFESYGTSLLEIADEDPHQRDEHNGAYPQRHVTHSELKVGKKWLHIQPRTAVQSPRTNAFSLLPIEAKGHIPMAYEFFFHVFAPRITRSSTCCQPNSTWGLVSGFQAFVQVLLQDAMLFEQIMALALVMRSFDDIVTKRDTTPSLYHSKRSLKQLRQRLQSDVEADSTSDAVVMTIIGLATMTFLIRGSYDTVSVYLQALQSIVEVRGGYEKLGWNGTLALKVRGLGIWLTAARRRPGPRTVVPVYPEHPFKPALCQKLSKLPAGFRDLALGGRFSIQFIDLVEEVTALSRSEVHDKGSAGAIVFAILGDYCWPKSNDEIANTPKIMPLERVLAFTLLAYCHCLGGHSVPSVEINLRAHIRSFPRNRDFYVLGEQEEDALDWAALMLRATTESTGDAWTWAAQILYTTTMISEHRQKLLEKAFFPIPKSVSSEPKTVTSASLGTTARHVK